MMKNKPAWPVLVCWPQRVPIPLRTRRLLYVLEWWTQHGLSSRSPAIEQAIKRSILIRHDPPGVYMLVRRYNNARTQQNTSSK